MFLKISQFYFQWVQLIDSIPEKWKFTIKKNNEVAANLITHQGRIQEFRKRGRSGLVSDHGWVRRARKFRKLDPLYWPKMHLRSVTLNYLSLQKFINILMK